MCVFFPSLSFEIILGVLNEVLNIEASLTFLLLVYHPLEEASAKPRLDQIESTPITQSHHNDKLGMVRDKVKAVDQIHADPGLPMYMYPLM